MGALLGLGLLLSILCFIRLEYNYKSLLVLRARLGNEHGRWKPVYTDFREGMAGHSGRSLPACWWCGWP